MVNHSDIKPANFKDVTPGETTREAILEKLGEPADRTHQEGVEVWTYAIGPFPKVRVTLTEDVVSSIVIHLAGPSARADVAKELGLKKCFVIKSRSEFCASRWASISARWAIHASCAGRACTSAFPNASFGKPIDLFPSA